MVSKLNLSSYGALPRVFQPKRPSKMSETPSQTTSRGASTLTVNAKPVAPDTMFAILQMSDYTGRPV